MTIKRINPGKRMSEAVIHNGTVYVAGQVADDPKADAAGQTKQILAAIDRILAEAGSDKTKILQAQIFLFGYLKAIRQHARLLKQRWLAQSIWSKSKLSLPSKFRRFNANQLDQ
jgi:enamine deaminase RidA (YjgF/YER057c/UK114 family)